MTRTTRLALAAGLLASGLTTGVTTVAPAPVQAAARISVVNDKGTSGADNLYRTKLTVNASGFQPVQGGFGGIYVMFGWVDDPRGGSWKPSKGGLTGSDYRYIPDAEDASNQGYLRFVAFPGSSTADEAHAVVSKSGSFRVSITVPGPTFQSVDRNGKVGTVDCTVVTCGVITIGAHGVKNAVNETFTPVPFKRVYDAAPATSEEEAAAPAGPDPVAAGSGDATPANPMPAKAGRPKVSTDRLTAKVGNALAFTGTGFRPGEQVLGILDDGVAGIGPMLAGPSGEVAGILPLPGDLAPGTHELRLTGAASGGAATERFAVRAADETPEPVAAPDTDEDLSASRLFLVAAGALLVLALLGLALRRRRGAST